jgi:hypothetical protein
MHKSGTAIEAWFTPVQNLRLIVAIKLRRVNPSIIEVDGGSND